MTAHAIVLSGGGANGAYEVGVMDALCSGRAHGGRLAPVAPAVFVGTSVGSYNAAAMVSLSTWGWCAAVRQLRTVWVDRIAAGASGANGVFRLRLGLDALGRDTADLWAAWVPRAIDLAFSTDTAARRLLRLFDGGDLLSTAPLEALIADTLDVSRLVHTPTQLRIVACNWDTGEPVVFGNQADPDGVGEVDHHEYRVRRFDESTVRQVILASTAIPALFPRVPIGDAYFVDGGVVMNTPLRPAVAAGASVLHVIHLEPRLAPLPLGRSPSALEAMERILAATPARLIDADIRFTALKHEHARATGGDSSSLEIHRYFPRRPIGGAIGLLDFQRERMVELIELGFREAVEHDCGQNQCVVPAVTAGGEADRQVDSPSRRVAVRQSRSRNPRI